MIRDACNWLLFDPSFLARLVGCIFAILVGVTAAWGVSRLAAWNVYRRPMRCGHGCCQGRVIK